MATAPYSSSYFQRIRAGSRRSAREILPIVLELIRPRSAIDVGCGLGSWLAVLAELGVQDVVGMDGPYLDKTMMEISPDQFLPFDLTQRIRLDRTFDLVISLEVAEHLPRESAPSFIESLTALGPVILFSAAIPFQGGEHHVNEQWPEYWAELFRARGFSAIDCLRRRIWHNTNVEWWYAQNILLFVRRDYVERSEPLRRQSEKSPPTQLSIVHPECYLAATDPQRIGLGKLLSALPLAFCRLFRW